MGRIGMFGVCRWLRRNTTPHSVAVTKIDFGSFLSSLWSVLSITTVTRPLSSGGMTLCSRQFSVDPGLSVRQ